MGNPDMTQYLGVFLDEAREQLGLLETNILQMERGDTSTEILQVLFRAAHTVKGSSRAMGFTAVGDLTHHMEDVLDDLRNGRHSVTTDTVNVLLNCLDTLTELIDELAESGTTTAERDAEVKLLVARLDGLCVPGGVAAIAEVDAIPNNGALIRPESTPAKGAPVQQSNTAPAPAGAEADQLSISEYERTAIDAAIAAAMAVYQVNVTLSTDCLMKSVRAYMVLGALGELGTVLVSEPNEDRLDSEDFEFDIKLILAGACSVDEVETALKRIAEIDHISVRPLLDAVDSTAPATDRATLETPASDSNEPATPAVALPAIENPVPVSLSTPDASRQDSITPSGKESEKAAPAAHKPAGQSQTIRVDVERLDNLLNLIGEMVIDRTQIVRLAKELRQRHPHDEHVEQLIEGTDRLARITSELQDQVMKARMLPIDGVFQRMPRMVRDLAQKTDKDVQLIIEGGETELDRSVLEVLGDPLIHLLRNSVDHGIELPADRIAAGKPAVGVVRLAARHEENHIVIEISDDGGGIDAVAIRESAVKKGTITRVEADAMTEHDALMLIFASGVSTARVLSDISGRGVGMDIVRANLERLGGRIQVETAVGVGSTFTIRLPLTLAIVRGLTVRAGGGTYVFPLSCVDEMLRLGAQNDGFQCRSVGGQAAILLRDRTVPVISLAGALMGDDSATSPSAVDPNAYVVVIGVGAKKVGITVDALSGEQEVVIKSLGSFIGDVGGIAGATILGDGSVALIVDASKLTESVNDIGKLVHA